MLRAPSVPRSFSTGMPFHKMQKGAHNPALVDYAGARNRHDFYL
jgi:hypothetical protein